MRATVLGHTWMSRAASSCAIFSVVRRVQRIPVMGSPATSCLSAASMAAITSGVFFPPGGARHRGGGPAAAGLAGQQLLAPPGHGAGVETEQFGDAAVTAVADFE